MSESSLEKKAQPVNKNRRIFLALGATGLVTFIFGKLFGDFLERDIVSKAQFKNFTLTETGSEIKLTDNKGDEIFIIDKESFKE